MSEINNKNSVQQQAIQEYLQSLLNEVPEEIEQPVKKESLKVVKAPVADVVNKRHLDEPEEKQKIIGLEQLVAEVPDVITQISTEKVIEVKVEVKPEVKEEINLELQTQEEQQRSTEITETESAVPEWAEARFQCLMFNVSGLNLAVPLIKLNSVIPWNENITETPNQTDWYLGLVQHLKNQVKVIDTALLVMPENRHKFLENDSANRLSHILLVDDYKWGLACSSIGDVIWLNKDDVKWRKNKSSRAWLSGTSLEHLCAIMDTEVFAQMLNESD